MTDSESNIELANELGIDKQFIKEYKIIEEITCEILGNTDKKLEIPKQLTAKLLQKFHLKFRHCVFAQTIFITDCDISKNIIFSDCIFEKEVNFSQTKFTGIIDFREATFKNETDFSRAIFENKAIFKNETIFYATIFENKVDFREAIFKNETDFSRATFKKEVDFCQAKFTGIINFSAAIFENETDFSFATFEGKVDFREENLNIKKATFKDNVYFNNSHFYDYADFHECEFEKIACFYGVTFEEVPNFSQAIFKGSLNLVNANLNFDFEDLKEKIQEEYQKFFDEQDKRPLENIANDFRDSFRIFKNALIKDNNLLEASKYHKFELYAKEIELENKQPQKFSKDWIDKWVLVFYRILCDHHTNLISNLKWLVWLIALYSILLGKLPLFIWFPCLMLFICLAPLVYFLKDKNGIFVSQIISVVIILCVIFQEPKNIFGIAGLFTSDLNWWQNFNTAVYTILMALVLFSLQKTARKNSIVPS